MHVLRLVPKTFSVLPTWSAARRHEAASERHHLVALVLAAVAAAAALGDGSPGSRERILGATAIALCHAALRTILGVEGRSRERLQALGPGPAGDHEIRRFDRVHRAYVALESIAAMLGAVILASLV